jgi:hypothetical protein
MEFRPQNSQQERTTRRGASRRASRPLSCQSRCADLGPSAGGCKLLAPVAMERPRPLGEVRSSAGAHFAEGALCRIRNS